MGKMSLSIYMKGRYEEICALNLAEKQSQFIRSVYCVLLIASLICHSRGNGNPVFWVVMDSASSAE
jgi:hypothetical protein